MSKGSNAALELYLSGVLGLGFILGFWSGALPSYLALLFFAVTLIGAILYMVAAVREGKSSTRIFA
ncbi:MAG: hypothetical protein L0Y55_17705, partial [Anaerolineales bacterium]|nr:hypothetical protein [Anaerolineales bacterium]